MLLRRYHEKPLPVNLKEVKKEVKLKPRKPRTSPKKAGEG